MSEGKRTIQEEAMPLELMPVMCRMMDGTERLLTWEPAGYWYDHEGVEFWVGTVFDGDLEGEHDVVSEWREDDKHPRFVLPQTTVY